MTTEQALRNIKLSKNFTAIEFCNSKDGHAIMVPDIKLFENLQKLRDRVAVAVKITSGYRTHPFNASVGGSKNSNHTKGLAVDIQFEASKYTVDQLKELFASCGFTNIGIYLDGTRYAWFHLDIAPRWGIGNGWTHYKNSAVKIYKVGKDND